MQHGVERALLYDQTIKDINMISPAVLVELRGWLNLPHSPLPTLTLVIACTLHSRGLEALILILWKFVKCRSRRYDLIIGRILQLPTHFFFFFFCGGGGQKMNVPNQEKWEGDQPVQRHNAQQPLQPQTCVHENCPVEAGLTFFFLQFSEPVLKCI